MPSFDIEGVDFLAALNVPAYKIASFEAIDYELIKKIAEKNKPIILSTGMCNFEEIQAALKLLNDTGIQNIGLLKCVSAYPAPFSSMNLSTLLDYKNHFNVIPGLSDHSPGASASIAAVSLGAKIIEKHFTIDRNFKTPDSDFSMEPQEFKLMVNMIREAEQSLGIPTYGPGEAEAGSIHFRRSIFAIKNIAKGEILSKNNIRVIRPGNGIHPKYLQALLGQPSPMNIKRGEPLNNTFLKESTP